MSRARGRTHGCAHALLWASWTLPAAAQTPADGDGEGLTLMVVECERPAVDIGEVERVLHATLAPMRARLVRRPAAELAQPPPPGPVLWLDACGQPDAVVVRSQPEADAPAATHVLDLSDVPPEAAARTVALALAELQDSQHGIARDALPAEAEAGASSQPVPPSPAPSAQQSAAPRRTVVPQLAAPSGGPHAVDASASHGWSASAIGRHSLRAGPPLFGAAIGVQFGRVQAEVIAAGNRQSDRLGHVTFGFVALAATYDVVTVGDSVALALRPRVECGLAFGGGSAEGETAVRASTAYAPQAAVLGEAQLSTRLSGRVRLALALGGGVARGLDVAADDRTLGSTSGVVLAAALTLAGGL